jgi:hypothetical protein
MWFLAGECVVSKQYNNTSTNFLLGHGGNFCVKCSDTRALVFEIEGLLGATCQATATPGFAATRGSSWLVRQLSFAGNRKAVGGGGSGERGLPYYPSRILGDADGDG